MIILCTIPYAVTVNQLLVPHAIVGGGVTGICEIIYFATNTYNCDAHRRMALCAADGMGCPLAHDLAEGDTDRFRAAAYRLFHGGRHRRSVYRLFPRHLFPQ